MNRWKTFAYEIIKITILLKYKDKTGHRTRNDTTINNTRQRTCTAV